MARHLRLRAATFKLRAKRNRRRQTAGSNGFSPRRQSVAPQMGRRHRCLGQGRGDDMELHIAFPAPIGIKRLLARFAPIKKL